MLQRDAFIEKDLMMNILMNIDDWDGTVPTPCILKPKPLWSGKQIFSMFLPDLNLRRTSSWYKDSDPEDLSLDDSQVCTVLTCTAAIAYHFPACIHCPIAHPLSCSIDDLKLN
jgi:hypothetical protein